MRNDSSADDPITDLPIASTGASRPSGLRIAIASSDIAGPYHGGGVGSAYLGLALALAAAGHDVTILFVGPLFHAGTLDTWQAHFAARGIRFEHLPTPAAEVVWYGRRREAGYRCYQWLSRHGPFDVIHFPEWLGLPYYSLLAKRQGLAFADTTLCVGAHGPLRWSRFGDRALPSRTDDLVVDFMERRSVELADVVVSPSRYLLQWMMADGWRLPARAHVAQNLLPRVSTADPAQRSDDAATCAIEELVFFGRLDQRKGLPFFCDVLDRIAATRDVKVTFLGGASFVQGQRSLDYLATRARRWKARPTIHAALGRDVALEYLRGRGRLAVIPSLVENSPCTVQECIQERIPFLTSDRGGIPELVHADDRGQVTARLDVDEFAGRLEAILRSGQRTARPAVPFDLTRERWLAWHATLGEMPAPRPEPAVRITDGALRVSVCLAHYQRPRLVERMLDSIRGQTVQPFEVILVDDGSRGEECAEYLTVLGAEFATRGWRVVRKDNEGPGIARHRAAELATGTHLLFLDDDDVLVPHAIETLVDVARRTGADALTCVLRRFDGDAPREDSARDDEEIVPLGPALAAGLMEPVFGGTIYLVERSAYFAVGGFPTGRDVDEDWEFLLSLVTAGRDLQVVPEPLLWYRQQASSRSNADNRFLRAHSRIQRYEHMLPFELRDFAGIAMRQLGGFQEADVVRRFQRIASTLMKAQQRKLGGARRPPTDDASDPS